MAILFLVCFSTGCVKDGFEKSNGVMTGYDISACSCCGGFYIEIGEKTLRIWNEFDDKGIDLVNENLPVSVKVKWRKLENACANDLIT